jgi:WD40 repeat protein
LASIGADKRTIIQSTDGSSVWAIPPGLSQANSIDFSPDGASLAEAYWEKLELWPMDDPSVGATRVEGLEPSIRLARFAPDGTRLTVALANTGLAQPAILHLDPESGEVLDSVTPNAPIEALVYSPGSQVFVTRSEEGLQVWPSKGSSPMLDLPMENVHALGFGPDGSTLFTAVQGEDMLEISSWNVQSGETVDSSELSVEGALTSAFAPDGAAVAVGNGDGTVIVQPLD